MPVLAALVFRGPGLVWLHLVEGVLGSKPDIVIHPCGRCGRSPSLSSLFFIENARVWPRTFHPSSLFSVPFVLVVPRCCGAIFCENCSRHRCLVPEPVAPPGKDPLDPTRPHRVCNACYADVQASQVRQ